MAELVQFISIANSSDPILLNGVDLAPNFTQRELWGGRFDPEFEATHDMAVQVIRGLQIIRNWANGIDSNVGVVITNTYRTQAKQLDIASRFSDAPRNSPHMYGIAIDLVFFPLNGQNRQQVRRDMTRRYNTEIRDKTQLYVSLRSAGIGGFGLYGPSRGPFVHIDARNAVDRAGFGNRSIGTDSARIHGGQENMDQTDYGFGPQYSIWAVKSPEFLDEPITEEVPEEPDQLQQNPPVPVQNPEVHAYTIRQTDPHTMEELVSLPLVDFPGSGADAQRILSYSYQGRTNDRRIFDATPENKRKELYNDSYVPNATREFLPRGIVIYLPKELVGISRPVQTENNPQPNNPEVPAIGFQTTFIDNFNERLGSPYPFILKELTNDPGYVPAYKNRGIDAEQRAPAVSVMAWSRAKYLEGESGWIDLTPYIITCSTNQTDEMGSFSLVLSPLIGRKEFEEDAPTKWEKVGEVSPGTHQGAISKEREFVRPSEGVGAREWRRNEFYFDAVLQRNDLIYISYEQLQFEERSTDASGVITPANKWHDMVGLVSNVVKDINHTTADGAVTVSGQDMTKALADDHAFFSIFSIGNKSSLVDGDIGSNDRNVDGSFWIKAAVLPRTMAEQFQFVFHYISTVGYVPDDIFSTFDQQTLNRKTKHIDSVGVESVHDVKGVYKIIKVYIDESVKRFSIMDDSLVNPNGSMLDILKNAVQDPWVQMVPMTIGDKFWLTIRRPPFSFEDVSKIAFMAPQSHQIGGTVGGTATGDTNAFRRFQDRLRKKRRDDFTNEGSALGQNEIFADSEQAQDDRFDAFEALEELAEASVVDYEYPTVINIDDKDVIQESLTYDERAYAWYQVENTGDFFGQSFPLGFVPAVHLEPFAQVFGNRPYRVTSQYTNWIFNMDQDEQEDSNTLIKASADLLLYAIETTVYLPFTRTGQITMQGDRRIKPGMFVFFRPTKELFYVKAAVNTIAFGRNSVERQTVLTVERGMHIDHIKFNESDPFSYFNIVNIQALKDKVRNVFSNSNATFSDTLQEGGGLINEEVFNYFLQRRQRES